MTHRRSWLSPLLLAAMTATLPLSMGACSSNSSDEPNEVPEESLTVNCPGKCDGWSDIKKLMKNPKDLDLGDLLAVASGYATEGLNDALDVTDYATIQLETPKLYTTSERAADDLTLGDIDKLASGLATVFGDKSLTTEVNKVRASYLHGQSTDVVYGECGFQMGPQLNHGWNIDTGSPLGNINLGFKAGATLSTRVIAAFDDELKATGGAPLAAIRTSRGFVVPRSLDDIREMKPGESIALSGDGVLGMNVGVGVPILIAQPIAAASYSFVISAGMRTELAGNLDVQLVRLDDDTVVVDVGVSKISNTRAYLALEDAWGVQGLLKNHVSLCADGACDSIGVGPIDVDLGNLVDKALRKELNKKLDFISARYEKSKQVTRLNVARLRFSLDQADAEGRFEKALAQALRGDIRLAQALANRGDPGVVAEFDLSRSGVSANSYAGVDVFGMKFYREVAESSGSVVVQTPGGARTLLFDTLHKEGGWFFESHGYTRTSLSGLVFDPRAATTGPVGEANLFVQVEEGDEWMQRDTLLDQLDSVLFSVAGEDAFATLENTGNELQRYVVDACPDSQAYDPCRTEVLSDPTVVQLRQKGQDDFAAAITHLTPDLQNLVLSCAELRLTAQAVLEPQASLVGPSTSIVVDYRLDDNAIRHLMTERSEYEFKNAVIDFLKMVDIDRSDSFDDINADRAEIATSKEAAIVDKMAELYKETASQYVKLDTLERTSIESLGEVGQNAIEVRFPVDRDGVPDYESAAAQSLPQARARLFADMYDALVEMGKKTGQHEEQPVSYALLSLTPADMIDLRVDVDMDVSDNFGQSFEHYREAGYESFDAYGRGDNVAPIDGGMFNVNSLISSP